MEGRTVLCYFMVSKTKRGSELKLKVCTPSANPKISGNHGESFSLAMVGEAGHQLQRGQSRKYELTLEVVAAEETEVATQKQVVVRDPLRHRLTNTLHFHSHSSSFLFQTRRRQPPNPKHSQPLLLNRAN